MVGLAEWALHVSKQRQNDRPRHSSDRAGVGVTEFSGVPAYTPKKLLASGMPPRDVAQNLGVSVPTLYRWIPASTQP